MICQIKMVLFYPFSRWLPLAGSAGFSSGLGASSGAAGSGAGAGAGAGAMKK